MSALRRGTPTPFWRLLTLLVAVGQLLVVGAAWLDVSAGGRDQRTHVESGGTRQHYVHDDSTCDLCALQHMASAPSAPRAAASAAAPAASTPRSDADSAIPNVHAPSGRPRAPPSNG